MMKNARSLDKFYTTPEAARLAVARAASVMERLDRCWYMTHVVEPSAGAGVFVKEVMQKAPFSVRGFDVEPEAPCIQRRDFFTLGLDELPGIARDRVVIGNPPFGKKGRLALAFLNHALTLAPIVAFVLPVIFRKWNTQKRVDRGAHLVADFEMDPNSFEFKGVPYPVQCCFQVWTTESLEEVGLQDLRLKGPISIRHPDFEMYQYNATSEAEKFIAMEWDFAVLRQGYGDYTQRITDRAQIALQKQWAFFKAHTPEVRQRLWDLDFEALSRTNTSVRGFGKAEVMAQYRRQYEGEGVDTQTQMFEPRKEPVGMDAP